MRLRLLGAAVLACALALAGTTAHARHRHRMPRHDSVVAVHCVFTNMGRVICPGGGTRTTGRARAARGHVRTVRRERIAATAGVVVGRRPRGCPYEYCGCEASRYLFGVIKPGLNLAANWFRFPRTAPAPGMAAVRQHHVMVLMRQVSGRDWLVHDGNSGGHLTREHVRSIAGFVIVNPRARVARL